MNKRRRAILEALTPAVQFALDNGKASRREVAGLAFTPRASADTPAKIMIYGPIAAYSWYGDGISSGDVAALLKEAGPGAIDVFINSPGGDVFQGVAIHTLLARHPGTVTTYVDGLAASAASFVMLAGDRIVSARNAFIMIHDAMTMTYGNGDTHRAAGELLDKVSANIADMYAERAGEDAEHWRNLMTVNGEDGTWYTGQEALDAGLVDEITAVAEDEDDGTEASSVARLLAAWQGILPEAIAASINFPAEPQLIEPDGTVEDVSRETPDHVQWDADSFREMLKGVFA